MSFKRLDPEDITISAESIVAPAWSNQTVGLTTFFTSSTQVNGSVSSKYYISVFNENPTGSNSSAQFEIAYGNENGGGSLAFNQTAAPGVSPASTIFTEVYETVPWHIQEQREELGK